MHKVDVCFFASLREKIGINKITIEFSGIKTINEIKEIIAVQIKERNALFEEGIQTSIDFDFARGNSQVDPAKVKEIAFFPPVTGG